MSLFGALMGDLDDDPIFGHHMRSMRQMNSLMSSLMGPDPFSMLSPFDGMGGHHGAHAALTGAVNRPNTSLMPFGFQSMPNINRLLNGDLAEANGGQSYCSSSFVSMTQGPDGRPQVYQATSSTKTGPGGLKETRKTVQDTRTGVKKMAIGHHIGERAHIIEKEQNVRNGQLEERQDYINLDEDEAEDFDREFTTKARRATGVGPSISAIGDSTSPLPHSRYRQNLQALPAPPSSSTNSTTSTTTTTTTPTNATSMRRLNRNIQKVNPRRTLRTPSSSPLALTSQNPSTSPTSVHPHPYNSSAARRNRHKKPSSQMNSPRDH